MAAVNGRADGALTRRSVEDSFSHVIVTLGKKKKKKPTHAGNIHSYKNAILTTENINILHLQYKKFLNI